MKKELIFGSLLALSGIANAQWTGVSPNPIWTNQRVGSGISGPAAQLHTATSGATQFQAERFGSGNQDNAFRLFFTSNPSPGMVVGGGSSIFQNTSPYGISDMLFMPTPSSHAMVLKANSSVGIGTLNPGAQLEVETSNTNDGINIVQSGNGACALHMYNNTSGGNHWALFSTGQGNTQGAGNFSLFQYGASNPDRLQISGSTGNVLIGAGWNQQVSQYYRLHAANYNVNNNAAWQQAISYAEGKITTSSSSVVNHVIGSKGYIVANGGIYGNGVGVMGESRVQSTNINQNSNIGIDGLAVGGDDDYGVFGNASAGSNKAWSTTAGVSGQAHADLGNAFGIEGFADVNPSGPGIAAAGMFWGDILVNGTWYPSDKHLKEDIKPVTSALEKIQLLKPSTYNYKSAENKGMHLPQGKQLGLIAQELEEVFPDLVKERKGMTSPDPDAKPGEHGRIKLQDYKTVNYMGLIPVLIAGMQEQQAQIEEQAKINFEQQKQIDEQKVLISELLSKAQTNPGNGSTNPLDIGRVEQNEPNPFSDETVIRYSLPASVSSAFVAVYDLSGKQITTFPIDQRGASPITITAEKLPAGIYFYSVVADNKIMDTKRMVVAPKN